MEDEADREDSRGRIIYAQDWEKSMSKTVVILFAVIFVGSVGWFVIDRAEPFLNWIVSFYTEACDIANTPLSHLTIAKILILLFYTIACYLIVVICWGVWKMITGNDSD